MTTIRRPNRRRIPELGQLINEGQCPSSGKVRYLDGRVAAIARRWLVAIDPDPARAARLGVYQCDRCGDWHVGHAAVPRGTSS